MVFIFQFVFVMYHIDRFANDSENMTTQNLWDSVKAVLSGRFIAIQAYLKKQEKIK